jgi:YHS domain-containing protein
MRNLMRASAVASVGLLLAGGCASAPSGSTATTASVGKANPHAECLVCKHNADLACIDVELEKDTPSYVYNGKTYYFCSDTCAKKFKADPAKYVNQK